jgi:hypothetical protein
LPIKKHKPIAEAEHGSDYQKILDAQASQINDQLKGGLKVCHIHFAGSTKVRIIAARVKNDELQGLPMYAARHKEDEGFWHTIPTGSRIDIS